MPTPFRGVGLPNSIFIVDDNSDIRAGIRRQLELSWDSTCVEKLSTESTRSISYRESGPT
jgi:hypothetical protein